MDEIDRVDAVQTEEVVEGFTESTRKYEIAIHNDWTKAFASYLHDLLDQRRDYIIKHIEDLLPKDSEF